MAEISYPYHDQEITDAEYSDLARDYMPTGVVKRTSTGQDLQVTANSTGMRVSVLAGRGNVRGHRYRNTTTKELTILPREGQARIDTVVMRSEYGSVNNCRLFVKKGEAGPSPKPPTLERTAEGVWEEALADVMVAATAVTISPANVADRRTMVLPAGGAAQDAAALIRYASSPPGVNARDGVWGAIKSFDFTSPVRQKVMLVVNYDWFSAANAAGYEEVRVGTTLQSAVSVSGAKRSHNNGDPAPQAKTLVCTTVLEVGVNNISLWAQTDPASGTNRTLVNAHLDVYPL